MKGIIQFISEKLKLNKDIDFSKFNLIEKAEKIDEPKNSTYFYIFPNTQDIDKMQGYKNKGSKPRVLVNSIKDNEKLERRFGVAVRLKWEEAIEEFGQALIDRNVRTEEEILYYIAKHYIEK